MQSSTKEKQSDKEADYYLPKIAKSYHFPNVGEYAITKILSRLNGKLGRQVINGAHENAISFHTTKSREETTMLSLFLFIYFKYSVLPLVFEQHCRSQSYRSWSMCWLASYMQKGFSMVVHSAMNSMEPPVSAEMSQIAKNLARIDKEKGKKNN